MCAAALVLAALAGCSGADEPAEGPAAEPGVIRLGTLVPTTGPDSHTGASMLNGAMLAVDEVNAAGGVLGRQVELMVEDDAGDPGAAAQALVRKDIAVSVGGYGSSAVPPIFRSAGVPMIIARAGSAGRPAPGDVFLIAGRAPIVPRLVPELADWSARYTAAIGSPPGPSTVEAYDAVNVALNAIERAGGLDPEAVRRAIAATDSEFLSGPVSFVAVTP